MTGNRYPQIFAGVKLNASAAVMVESTLIINGRNSNEQFLSL